MTCRGSPAPTTRSTPTTSRAFRVALTTCASRPYRTKPRQRWPSLAAPTLAFAGRDARAAYKQLGENGVDLSGVEGRYSLTVTGNLADMAQVLAEMKKSKGAISLTAGEANTDAEAFVAQGEVGVAFSGLPRDLPEAVEWAEEGGTLNGLPDDEATLALVYACYDAGALRVFVDRNYGPYADYLCVALPERTEACWAIARLLVNAGLDVFRQQESGGTTILVANTPADYD